MRRFVCVLFSLLCLTLAVRANAPDELNLARVFVGNGRAFTVGKPRQLTWNAHVSQVLVQPGSLEAAYVSSVTNGDTVTNTVKLVGFRHGETWTLLSASHPENAEDVPTSYHLEGWSNDGRTLLVSHLERTAPTDTAPERYARLFDSVDVSSVPFKVRPVPLPGNSAEGAIPEGAVQVSPSGNLLAIPGESGNNGDTKAMPPLLMYDVTHRSTRRVSLPAGFYMVGWDDETHLLVCHSKARVFQYGLLDTATGMAVPISHTRFLGSPPARAFPEVTLWLLERSVLLPAPGDRTNADARALWLTVKGAKPKLAPICLAVALGTDSMNAQFVPNQSAALWVANGDLYASTFSVDAATARERYDAGDVLTCDEEREIATDNAKQLGLGLLMYTQDYDEQFPPAANFHDGVTPYVKNDSLFQVRQYPFQYAAPTDLHVSSMDDVSHTVLGTINLPCATVTLYADGHVKSLPRPEPGTLAP